MRYEIGLALGLAAGIAVGLLLIVLLFKVRVLDMHFDERQERARGVAFKYGFFTLVICALAVGCVDTVWHWCDAMTASCISICIGVTVFAVTAIRRDAYLGLHEKPRAIMALFAVLALVNLAVGVRHLLEGTLVENGIVTFRVTNLLAGAMIVAIMAAYAAKYLGGGEPEDEA